MPRVHLNGNLKLVAGGESEFDIDASTIRGILKGLTDLHPQLEPHLDEGIAVAINGEIFQDAWFADVPEDAEVHIMPAIGGG